jgi:hypothetical protein
VVQAAVLLGRQNQSTTALDVVDRLNVGTAVAAVSGAAYWTFFTPVATVTVSQISYASVNAASGVTLARFGIYTMDASGQGSLVARTGSDTTLFSAANTVYTRSLNTTGGYPATYTLQAGTRYAVALCIVATGVTGTTAGTSAISTVAALSPRVQGVRTGANDLLTFQGSGQYNGTVGHAYWARLS